MVPRGSQAIVNTNIFFFLKQIVFENIESHAAVKRTSIKPKTMIVPNDQMNFTRNDLTHLNNGYRFKVIFPSKSTLRICPHSAPKSGETLY